MVSELVSFGTTYCHSKKSCYIHCVSKNAPTVVNCIFKRHGKILFDFSASVRTLLKIMSTWFNFMCHEWHVNCVISSLHFTDNQISETRTPFHKVCWLCMQDITNTGPCLTKVQLLKVGAFFWATELFRNSYYTCTLGCHRCTPDSHLTEILGTLQIFY